MNMEDIFKISGAIIGSVGGAAVIIFAFSSWLGHVWANRILEKDKLKYSSELEKIKTKLNNESQKQNLMFSMYFEGQFKLYNDLWISLSELQSAVDALWAEASPRNLKSFVSIIKKAKKQIRHSALLIEPRHYDDIMDAIEKLEDYHAGKEQLIFARGDLSYIDDLEVDRIINENCHIKDRITHFVNTMLANMRSQIGGNLTDLYIWKFLS